MKSISEQIQEIAQEKGLVNESGVLTAYHLHDVIGFTLPTMVGLLNDENCFKKVVYKTLEYLDCYLMLNYNNGERVPGDNISKQIYNLSAEKELLNKKGELTVYRLQKEIPDITGPTVKSILEDKNYRINNLKKIAEYFDCYLAVYKK